MSNTIVPTVDAVNTTSGTEVVKAGDDSAVQDAIDAIRSGQALAYSSITGTDYAAKLSILTAVTDSEPFADNLGKTIQLKDIIIQVIPMTDEQTGEVVDQPRILLLDDEGTAYHAISSALLRSLNNIIGIMGEPSTWEAPVPATLVKAGQGTRQYYTLKFGPAKRK
jgi:hypothetical protein